MEVSADADGLNLPVFDVFVGATLAVARWCAESGDRKGRPYGAV